MGVIRIAFAYKTLAKLTTYISTTTYSLPVGTSGGHIFVAVTVYYRLFHFTQIPVIPE